VSCFLIYSPQKHEPNKLPLLINYQVCGILL
jgi:hypothetical protein